MVKIRQKGNFDKTEKFLKKKFSNRTIFEKYGEEGVKALSAATPVDTGLTASSWYYKVVEKKGSSSIEFCNSNINDGVPIAIIIQYGHGTGNGGWVEGNDYINPAIQPIFEKIKDEIWREVTKR